MALILRPRLRCALAVALLLGLTACFRPPLEDPPFPEGLDEMDVAVAEWIWKALETVEDKPGEVQPWLNLCATYQANGLMPLATQCYERILESEPKEPRAWFHLACLRHAVGDTESAVEAMETSLRRLRVDYLPALARLGAWQWELGRYEAAEQSYRRAYGLDSSDAGIQRGLAATLMARGAPDEALTLLYDRIGADPSDSGALELLQHAKEQEIDASPEFPEEMDLDGVAGRDREKDPWAAGVEMFYVGYRARLDLIRDYLHNEEIETANRIADELRDSYQNDGRVGVPLAEVYIELNRPRDATLAVMDALEDNPDDPSAVLVMASIKELTGRTQQALKWVDRAIELDPQLGSAYARKGAILRRQKSYDKAIAAFMKAEELSEPEKRIPQAIGDCQSRLSQWADAIASYERAIEIDPEDPELHARIAFAYMKASRLDEAEQALSQALELETSQPEAVERLLAEVRRRQQAS